MRTLNAITLLFLTIILCNSCNAETKKVQLSHELFEAYSPKNAGDLIFVVISPKGDGKLAMEKFVNIATESKAHVIGLNNVENGVYHYEKEIRKATEAFVELKKIKSPEFILCGFSGGAKMAFRYGFKNKVKGVIMCGAGIGNYMNKGVDIPVAFITGFTDFAYHGSYYDNTSPLMFNENVLTIHFNGGHEWPDENNLRKATQFIFRSAELNFEKSNKKILKQIKDDNIQLAMIGAQFGYKASSSESIKEQFKVLIDTLISNPEVVSFYEAETELLRRENFLMQYLYNAFETKSFEFWKEQIDKIKAQMDEDSPQGRSFMRAKASLGVGIYSFINRQIRENIDHEEKLKLIKVYELLEPENPDMFFFYALYYKQQDDTDNAKKYLDLAKAAGYSDEEQIKRELGGI